MYRTIKIICQILLVLLMASEYATGTILIDTGVATTEYSVTGVTPATGSWKAIKLWWSGRADTTDASGEQDIQPGIGVAVSSASRWAVTAQSDHGPTTTATDRYHTDAACVALLAIDGTVSALADFVSFNSDGFTLVVDDAFPAALEVSYELFGGTDLTDVATGSFTTPVGTGLFDAVISLSFQPDFALFGAVGVTTAPPVAGAVFELSIGAATNSGQAVLIVEANDGAGTSLTQSYCRSGEIFAIIGATAGSVIDRISFDSFLSNGFKLNNVEVTTSGRHIFYLAMKGGSYAVGNFTTATDLNNFTESVGFVPKGMSFYSANRAESTVDTATAHAEWSVGSVASPTSRNAQYVRDKNGAGSADCFSAVEHDECYINASNATTQIIEGLMDIVGRTSDVVTLVMDDADPVASFVWYVAFGDAAPLWGERSPWGDTWNAGAWG